MKTIIIINPVAGKGNGRKILPVIEKYLYVNNISCDIKLTQNKNDATKVARACSDKYDRVIVAGGDGTLNEVINGVNFNDSLEVGVLPIGSGNDFASALRLDANIESSLDLLFSANPNIVTADLGFVTIFENNSQRKIEKYFINSCGIGFDAHVAYLNQTDKKFSGLLSYLYAIFRALREHNSVNITAKFDELAFEGENLFVSIGNGQTAGGGLFLTPHAFIDDNLLDFTLVEKISRLKLIKYLPLVMMNKIDKIAEATLGKFASASVTLKNPFYVHVDGEIISKSAEIININTICSKIKFITP